MRFEQQIGFACSSKRVVHLSEVWRAGVKLMSLFQQGQLGVSFFEEALSPASTKTQLDCLKVFSSAQDIVSVRGNDLILMV